LAAAGLEQSSRWTAPFVERGLAHAPLFELEMMGVS
jgi:hypothetical protein